MLQPSTVTPRSPQTATVTLSGILMVQSMAQATLKCQTLPCVCGCFMGTACCVPLLQAVQHDAFQWLCITSSWRPAHRWGYLDLAIWLAGNKGRLQDSTHPATRARPLGDCCHICCCDLVLQSASYLVNTYLDTAHSGPNLFKYQVGLQHPGKASQYPTAQTYHLPCMHP